MCMGYEIIPFESQRISSNTFVITLDVHPSQISALQIPYLGVGCCCIKRCPPGDSGPNDRSIATDGPQ